MRLKDDDFHFLVSSWSTACGMSRHFVANTTQIATKLSEVTCEECLSSEEYKKHIDIQKRELSSIKEVE